MFVAKDGDGLEALVRAAVPLCREAGRLCPRRGPGRKPTVPDWVIAVLIMAATAKRRKSKSAQYRFLREHRLRLCGWMETDAFPGRTQYFDRFRRAHGLLQSAMELQTRRAIRRGWIDARAAAVDKSLVPSRGEPWHRRDRVRGRVPPGVDVEATWTFSEYHGWVEGYGFEVVVSAGKRDAVWPLCASVDQAHLREQRTAPLKLLRLPTETQYVLADSGYDSNDMADLVELAADGAPSGRRFVCPLQERHNAGRERRHRESRARRARRLRRDRRRRWLKRPGIRRLYARRGVTVEPFNERFKTLFELHHRAWHRGLDNNRTQILAALFTYQLLLAYNHRRGRRHAQVAYILDGL